MRCCMSHPVGQMQYCWHRALLLASAHAAMLINASHQGTHSGGCKPPAMFDCPAGAAATQPVSDCSSSDAGLCLSDWYGYWTAHVGLDAPAQVKEQRSAVGRPVGWGTNLVIGGALLHQVSRSAVCLHPQQCVMLQIHEGAAGQGILSTRRTKRRTLVLGRMSSPCPCVVGSLTWTLAA